LININKIIKTVGGLNELLAKIVPYFLAAMMPIITYEVIMRYVFNSPTVWAMEISTYLFCFSVAFGGGWNYLKDGHVRVDVIYDKLSPRRKAFMDLFSFPLLLLFLLGFLFATWKQAYFSIKIAEHSGTLWEFPIYIVRLSVFIGGALLFLQSIATFLSNLITVVKKEEK